MSNKFVIIPDSSCDMPRQMREQFGITDYVPGVIYFPDGHEEKCDMDWGSITPKEFFESMKAKDVLYRTATPKVEDVERIFEKYLSQGIDVLSISLSSGLSATYQNSLLVARDLQEKYPERKIICVDSLRYSKAMALVVIMACKKRDEGATIEETAAYITEKRHCVHQMGPMDDLFFLVKTHRVSNFKAFFGTLAGVNPMADNNTKGMSEVFAKIKGKKAALEATVMYLEKLAENPQDQVIYISQSNRQESAELLAQMVRERIHPKDVIIDTVGMSCGASIGPGLCTLYFMGQPISEDNQVEKAAMAEIMAWQKKNKKK